MRLMSSFVVTPGVRAVSVAPWCLKSCGCKPSGAPIVRSARRHAAESVARRSGAPAGPVKTGESASGPVNSARWSPSASTTIEGMATRRRPASLFGSRTVRPSPLSSCAWTTTLISRCSRSTSARRKPRFSPVLRLAKSRQENNRPVATFDGFREVEYK